MSSDDEVDDGGPRLAPSAPVPVPVPAPVAGEAVELLADVPPERAIERDSDPIVAQLDPLPPATANDAPEELPPPPDAADMPPRELRAVIEALLLVATKPLTVARLTACIPGVSAEYLGGFLEGLAARFDHEGRGWELLRIANGWQLLTRRAHHPWVRQLERKELPTKLTRGCLETLAIVAYKQPVARGAIEDIRGVQCGPVLRQLMDLRLVAVIGREEGTLGRPLLYGTTDLFLNRFGLGSIADLPKRHEFG